MKISYDDGRHGLDRLLPGVGLLAITQGLHWRPGQANERHLLSHLAISTAVECWLYPGPH
jgi:hypothetical protein